MSFSRVAARLDSDGVAARPSSFSPIPPALIRIGEGEPPPSWDRVPTPKAMVGRGSPKFNMVGRGSPKFNMVGRGSPKFFAMVSSAKKKNSPSCSRARGSPRGKTRASWNPTLERSLVDILHEHDNSCFRGDNGWTAEGWNKMVKEFHDRNKYTSFTKSQIQEKEKELKRDYKMLKEAKRLSGCTWNEERCMIQAEPALWDNLIVSFPKIKKFRNNKATFPLFDALGELYDGKLAEGTYNYTSIESLQEVPPRQIDSIDEIQDLEETMAYNVEDEELTMQRTEYEDSSLERAAAVLRNEGGEATRRATAVPKSKEGRETKKQKKNSNIEGMMERYLEMRTRQAEDEAAQLAKEKEVAQGNDFSIKRCVSVLNSMEVTKEEKAKSYAVFKNQENREIFLSACCEDPESAMIWLRNEMA